MLSTPNTQPIFIRTPRIWSMTLQTELGGTYPASTLTPKSLAIGGDAGSAIETIEVVYTSVNAISGASLYLYIYDSVGTQGQNRLLSATAIDTQNTDLGNLAVGLPATASPASPNPITPNRILRLPAGWELRAALSSSLSDPIIVNAYGGDY
jgi:hypothetical protein